VRIERLEEFRLTPTVREQIAALLKEGFGVYPEGRTFYKQLPDFRYLAWDEDSLLGHLAAEYRIINVGGHVLPIVGVADLCVTPSRQQERIATQMLQQLEALAREAGVEFILLTGSEPNVYQGMGFERLERACRWLLMNNLSTLGVIRRSVSNIMIKCLGERPWPEGEIDFLGHIF
jgi:predicted N-acetyltransferase YhbS